MDYTATTRIIIARNKSTGTKIFWTSDNVNWAFRDYGFYEIEERDFVEFLKESSPGVEVRKVENYQGKWNFPVSWIIPETTIHDEETFHWKEETSSPEEWIERLKAALDVQNISQAEFARRCGCSPSTINQLLKGSRGALIDGVPKYIWKEGRTIIAAGERKENQKKDS